MNVRPTRRPGVAIRDCSPPFGPRRSRELFELRARIVHPKWVNRENAARSPANERAFPFLRLNERQPKPRTRGITEIRGPYYTPLGTRQLDDILETMGAYVDALKFAGGSFSLMPRQALKQLIAVCHSHDVLVSTGGFIERVLTLG